VLTVSTPQTETLIRLGYPRDRISLIRNGVDLKFFRPLPFDGVPPFTFGYVGQFQVWQGTENLIEAFERIDGPSIRMLVVGFTEKDGRVKDIFHDRFGPRVELVNRTDRNSIVELIKSVAILIIPRIAHQAIRHAFPTKFAEYAALGRPIVVNDVDETADFVRKYNCGFVSEPNPEAMAAVMSQAAQVPLETLEEMGKRARQMAEENFSWEMIGDEYAALIRRLIPARQQGK
jgi:glycosyltransferase involved in cell wall biosynthesis